MRRVHVGVYLFLSCVTSTFAADAVQCQVKGRGPTRDKALQMAFMNAVTKVHGAAMSTGIANVDMNTGGMGTVVNPLTGSRTTTVDSVSVQSAGTLTLMETRGLVKSYEIVEEKNLDAHTYEITADVWVYDYHSPEKIKEIRLAVPSAEVTARTCLFGPQAVTPASISRQFTQLVNTALSQNDKFTLLDRIAGSAIAKERRILEDSSVPLREKSRLQGTLGTDYLLSITIPQAEIQLRESGSPIMTGKVRRYDARLRVEYSLLVAATRQLVVADDFRIALEDNQVKGLAERWRSDRIDYEELRRNFLNLGATRVARRVTDYLRPVKIAAVVNGPRVILNQGGKRFIPNDQYEVFQLGQAIIDPETQKELARHEEKLGTIRITRVLDKICYAEVLDGSFSNSAIGSMVRWSSGFNEQMSRTTGQRESNVKQTSSGGVKLPFDK